MLKQLQIIETEINQILKYTSLNDPQLKSLIKIKDANKEILKHFINDG